MRVCCSANLSDQYFINRQDRYVVIQCKHFAEFCHELVSSVSALSYEVSADNKVSLSSQLNSHPYLSKLNFYEKVKHTGCNLRFNIYHLSKTANDNETLKYRCVIQA